jgi:hypothetical protein
MRTRRDLKLLSKAELELDLLDSERDIDRLRHQVRDLEDERNGAVDRMLAMENDLEDCVAVVHAVRRYRAGLLSYEALIAMVSEETPA